MKKKDLIIIISLISAAVVLAAGALILALNTPKLPTASDSADATAATAVAATDTATTTASTGETAAEGTTDPSASVEVTQAVSETSADSDATQAPVVTEASITAPERMESVLEQGGGSLQALSAYGCSQLITVSSSGSSAQIRFYSLEGSSWKEDESLSCSGYVGQNGVTTQMHEGGYASPWGLYSVGDAFYLYDQPQTGLNSFEITSDTYWVDDPQSSHYNRRVIGTADKDWNSAEAMAQIAGYKYGFVINYNTAAVPGAGSAIFFHISSGGTAGCVGTDESHVLGYLSALDASRNPYIVIV